MASRIDHREDPQDAVGGAPSRRVHGSLQRKTLITILALFLAGCLQSGPGEAAEGAGTVTPQATNSDVADAPRAVEFRDCPGMATVHTFPGNGNPGRPPGNWSGHRGVGSDIYLRIFRCASVTWGTFERGPVDFILEAHSNGRYPPACREGEMVELRLVLHAVWVSDAELAAYINETYGIRTHVAEFEFKDERTNEVQQVSWSWRVPPAASSTVSFTQPIVNPVQDEAILRFAWATGPDLWLLDLHEARILSWSPTILTPGRMAPPTLYSESGGEEYPGRGEADLGAEMDAKLQRFADHHCTSKA